MCKVRIYNRGNGYFSYHIPMVEADIPTEFVPVLEDVVKKLNNDRKSAIEPIIDINKI